MQEQITVSIVLPVFNEEECIKDVIEEIVSVMEKSGYNYEIITVDDGSTDNTLTLLKKCRQKYGKIIRIIKIEPNSGQSIALGTGFKYAKGEIIITFDADGQCNPLDIPEFIKIAEEGYCCCGYRENRKDSFSKIWGSKIANAIRNFVLKENIIDTGCPIKAFPAKYCKSLSVWNGIHRFIPTFLLTQGAHIIQKPIHHRPRMGGKSKYSNFKRALKTSIDLLGVLWLKNRIKKYKESEINYD